MLEFVNHTMNMRMETNDIVACHKLPTRKKETVKPIIVCLLNSAAKRDLMMGRNTLKGSRIFVNEQLPKKNAGLFKKSIEFPRTAPIDSTWTYNGRQLVKKRPRQQLLKKFASRKTYSRFQESELDIVEQSLNE